MINQAHQYRKWSREDNKLTLHGHFRSSLTQKRQRKIMVEIWEEFAGFNTTIPQQIHNVPNDDLENTNDTNQGGDLLFVNKPWTVPRRTERILLGDKICSSLIKTSSSIAT